VVPVESSYRPLYELLLVIYSNFRVTTPRFRNTNCFNAENYIFAYLTVSNLEFEGYAVGMWRRNLAPDN